MLRARKFRTKWDPAEISWIMQNINKGDVCFDIGTHKGGWTYWLRKGVGHSGRVFAFEPQPILYKYLRKLFTSRYWSNVTLEDIALSNREGTFDFFVPGQPGATSPGASLKEDVVGIESNVLATKVSTMTIDQYIAKINVNSIAFIKIDVEGSELDVIEGATTTLRDYQPNFIIESESRHIGEEGVLNLFSRMEDANYQGFFFSPNGLSPLSEFKFNTHQCQNGTRFWDQSNYCNNFLFTPNN